MSALPTTADDAIEYARKLGFTVWMLTERSDGTWLARMYGKQIARHHDGKPGYNDALSETAFGATPSEAILASLKLRVDHMSGKVVETELPEWLRISASHEKRLADALGALTAALAPYDPLAPSSEPYARLLKVFDIAGKVR